MSRYMHDPGKVRCQAVKWILWCLFKTVDVGFVFQCGSLGLFVTRYVDSDCACDLDKHWSTTRYVFTFTKDLVSCKSSLQ